MSTTCLENWVLKFREYAPLPCTAPCSLYSVLLDNHLIEDPFYGNNEQKVRDLCEDPCEFSCEFVVENISPYMELEFGGIDTICDIYLNGKKLDMVENMHRTFTYDVADKLTVGKNIVRLAISSPIEYFRDMERRHHVYTNVDSIQGAAQLRKALCMSGWDWGPQLPDMGIFRPVVLKCYDVDQIADFEIRQKHHSGKVSVTVQAQTKRGQEDCQMYVCIDGQHVLLEDGFAQVEIQNPKLWWPNGYGKQNLYAVEVELWHNGQVIDTMKKQIGLRTLTVSNVPDKYGKEFCFVVNGVKIFAMGANYVPQDNIFPRINRERTEKLIQSCIDANFNTLRVWGGGYYPEEFFFDLCDQYGIILWQDFMVACCNIHLRESFKQNFYAECEQQLKRFRHRACLGLICGNNEMETAILHWGDDYGNKVCDGALVRMDYLEFYERILPEMCYKVAPDVFYWPSSPSCGGEFDNPDDPTRGDQHFWAVWNGDKPFTEYRKHQFRFCSEFGYEAYPSLKTIRTFAEEKDMNLFSRVMDNHQKCKLGARNTVAYIAANYRYPYSFKTLVYTSQILQADAIKYGVEYFRRIRGCCMGAIYWQLNDCWPVASWSSVDYYGRYKALHYAARKFFAPVACALFHEDNRITVNIANETRNCARGTVKTYICHSDFTVLAEKEFAFCVDPLSSSDIGFVSDSAVEDKYDCYMYADLFDEKGNFIMRQTLLFAPSKHIEWRKPNISVEIQDCEDGVDITLSSDVFTKYVEIDFAQADVVLSDNYVDITSSQPVKLHAKTQYTAAELTRQLQVQSVYDIGMV